MLPRNAKRRVAKESWEKVKAERGWVIIEALSRSCSSNNREILADAFRVMPPSSEDDNVYRIVYIFNYTTIILPREREIDFNCDVNHITIFTIMIKRRELNDETKKGKMRGFAVIYRNSTARK